MLSNRARSAVRSFDVRRLALTQVLAGSCQAVPSARLDLDGMPDRVKRDLGFLDGRDPRYEDERLAVGGKAVSISAAVMAAITSGACP